MAGLEEFREEINELMQAGLTYSVYTVRPVGPTIAPCIHFWRPVGTTIASIKHV
jgi:hypothetical protein